MKTLRTGDIRYDSRPWTWSITIFCIGGILPYVLYGIMDFAGHVPKLSKPFSELLLLGHWAFIGVAAVWFTWVLPVYSSSRIQHLKFRRSPRQLIRTYHWTIWMPVIMLSPFALIDTVGEPIDQYYWMHYWSWPSIWLIIGWFALLVMISSVCHALVRTVERRLIRTFQAAMICIECGYDLQGSSGPTCPECGEPVPAADVADAPQVMQPPAEPGAKG